MALATMAGTRMAGSSSGGPASSNATLVRGSSDSRLASTHDDVVEGGGHDAGASVRRVLLEPEQRGDVVAVHVFADGENLAIAHIDAPGVAVVVVAAVQQLALAPGLAHHRVAAGHQPVDLVLGITRHEQPAHRPEELVDDLVARAVDARAWNTLHHGLPCCIRMQGAADGFQVA